MRAFSRIFARPWTLIAAVVILLAAHGLAFYFLRHLGLSAAVVSGIAVLAVVKHIGGVGSLYALFRKRFQKTRPFQQ
jgi:hypothetical protein